MGRPRNIKLNPATAEPEHSPAEEESPGIGTPADNSSAREDGPDTSKPPSTTPGSPAAAAAAEGDDVDNDKAEAEPEPEREPELDPELDPEPEPEPEPVPVPVIKRKRGRPPRNPAVVAAMATPTTECTPVEGSEVGGGGDLEEPSMTTPTQRTPVTNRKRRGRPPVRASLKSRGGPSHVTAVPLDKDGNPQIVENDEIVLAADPAGEQKVDMFGNLCGGREYRCRTFTIKGRGDRLYMLSTEPARCIGFRDSYLFFQKHKQLFKIIMDDDEKYDMIARNLIPHSYKGRAIGVVTARSVFREFGARIIVGGRKITDDYWEAREREAGAIEGELADPDDKIPMGGLKDYNRNQYVAWHGASSVYHTGQPSVPIQMQSERHQGRMREKLLGLGGGGGGGGLGSIGGGNRKSTVITDENWMLEHARAASIFNSELAAERARIASQGIYEPHTNLIFYPAVTQPTRVRWEGTDDGEGGEGRKLPQGMYAITQTLKTPKSWVPAYPYTDGPYGGQGMSDVSEETLEGLQKEFGEEIVGRVREQQGREKEWEDGWRIISPNTGEK